MKKVTFYSDEELLSEFFEDLLEKFEIKGKLILSSNEIKKNRPRVKYSSGNIIREDRDSR
ncbi:MAG: hypothetical protein HWN67_23020 [Candidatus Helarchaeota archaeon]|nr:hypothetical protein [Candidatus Helarchaeota archaeon]